MLFLGDAQHVDMCDADVQGTTSGVVTSESYPAYTTTSQCSCVFSLDQDSGRSSLLTMGLYVESELDGQCDPVLLLLPYQVSRMIVQN